MSNQDTRERFYNRMNWQRERYKVNVRIKKLSIVEKVVGSFANLIFVLLLTYLAILYCILPVFVTYNSHIYFLDPHPLKFIEGFESLLSL